MKINLGCGTDIRDGWENIDIDNYGDDRIMKVDLSKEVPFKDNSVDEILMDNFLEHIPRERILWFMDEIYRICKNRAKIIVYVPHYSSVWALGHIAHHTYFSSRTFDIMNAEDFQGNFERYNKARFKIKTKLLFFHHNYYNKKYLAKLNPLISWIFNIHPIWQIMCERLNILGFDEIKYTLICIK